MKNLLFFQARVIAKATTVDGYELKVDGYELKVNPKPPSWEVVI